MLRLALALILLLPISVAMADITGKPGVVDGDTIHIGKTKIRLHGIDAPEMKQTCRNNSMIYGAYGLRRFRADVEEEGEYQFGQAS